MNDSRPAFIALIAAVVIFAATVTGAFVLRADDLDQVCEAQNELSDAIVDILSLSFATNPDPTPEAQAFVDKLIDRAQVAGCER